MSKTIDAAKALKEEINNSTEYQEFIRNKKLYENNDDIKKLIKEIVRCKNENRLDDYEKNKKIYYDNPLVANYLSSKEALKNLLMTISKIIN